MDGGWFSGVVYELQWAEPHEVSVICRAYSEPDGLAARYQLRRNLPVVAVANSPAHDAEQDLIAPRATSISELAATLIREQISPERILTTACLRGSPARKPVLEPPPLLVVKLRSDQAVEREWAKRVFEGDLDPALPPDPQTPVVAKLWSKDYIRRWAELVVVGDIDPAFPRPNAASANADGDCIASFLERKDSYRTMTKEEILTAAAEHFGLDAQEAVLALRYAAASKEAARHAVTATPKEAERLEGLKRLRGLALDLYQRLKAAVLLPSVLENEQQCRAAGRLAGTFQEMRKLEAELKVPASARDPLVTKAEAQRKAYQRANSTPETPTTHRRRVGGGRRALVCLTTDLAIREDLSETGSGRQPPPPEKSFVINVLTAAPNG